MHEYPTIVVIGGTGHFGGRICRRLSRETDIELVVTSRNDATASQFAAELRTNFPESHVRSARLDQFSNNFENDFRCLNPDVVVHTAGPYQGQDYRVAEVCIECGSHYIDLADGREFVNGFTILNNAASESGVLLVSGASTLPGLSSAVIDSLRDRFKEMTHIEISIAPAHQTPRGKSTIAAVLSYCGKPFQVLVNGVWKTKYGWQDLRVQCYPKLGKRLSGACDVPDLALLPQYTGAKTVSFHAALEASWKQFALWVMAWISRLGLVKDWRRFVPTFNWTSDRLIKLGSRSGGMHIRLCGIDRNNQPKTCTWYLTARQNHGPEIPCVPALILVKKMARNEITQRGAYPCLGLITLSEFDKEAGDLDISWELVE